jgi:hypothetical protein
MTLILAPNLCLLFFRDPDAKFTSARLQEVLGDRLTETGSDPPFAFCWEDGPIFHLRIQRGDFVETIARRLMGRKRKYRSLIPGCDTQIEITFGNLEEVLHEMVTLIDLQLTLVDATGGLFYRSWNQTFSGPDG